MTTKPSSAAWADEPYKLITTPSTYLDMDKHYSVHAANEMSHSHNCLLRGLNAIVLQAPNIPSADQAGYDQRTVEDLLFLVESWVKMVEHHHHTEETCMFPEIEQLANKPGLLDGPSEQHKRFHDGLADLQRFAATMQKMPEKYAWSEMKAIIDGFAPAMVKHLYEEIEVILSLDYLDSDGLRGCWKKAEDVAKARGKISYLYDIFPVVLGCCDKTYEGGNDFPPLSGFMTYAIQYWFGKYNPGAWKMLPCDFFGQPRPLPLVSKS